uniref:G-protein coupled receptors family 1 profile domain-containing protein n=1 Tax=Timema cristinae TaxID=61476 RepID=A0A7R9GQ32_TIMCR|nr:unnamed protein product [Timema cristinae]
MAATHFSGRMVQRIAITMFPIAGMPLLLALITRPPQDGVEYVQLGAVHLVLLHNGQHGIVAQLSEPLREEYLARLTSHDIHRHLLHSGDVTEQFTVMWVLFALIVLGNSSVLVALLINKSRKSRMNFFIMQLALADLTVGLISVLTDIIWRITVTWHAGNLACKFIRFAQALVTYSSTYVLVALSIDRYDAITHPMNFSGRRRARVLVATAWVLSALFSIPIIILYEEKYVQGKLQCWIDFPEPWQWQLYMTSVAVALFIIPAIIISACYTVIVVTIWSKSKVLTPTGRPRVSNRMFVLCWSPYIVFDLLQVYGHVPSTQTNIAVATFIQSLAPLNSAANPVIYCLFSTHICRALRQDLTLSQH